MTWKPRDLNEAVVYAKGWNDAIRIAAKIVEDGTKNGIDMEKLASQIRELDRSMQAC